MTAQTAHRAAPAASWWCSWCPKRTRILKLWSIIKQAGSSSLAISRLNSGYKTVKHVKEDIGNGKCIITSDLNKQTRSKYILYLDNQKCRCYNRQQITEERSYVVFCIQQNESASVNCQSRRLAQFVVRVIFWFNGKRSVACIASDRFLFS